jgi:hypothetical protein
MSEMDPQFQKLILRTYRVRDEEEKEEEERKRRRRTRRRRKNKGTEPQ